MEDPGQGVMQLIEDTQVGEYRRRLEMGGKEKTGADRYTCKQNPPKPGMNRLEKPRRRHKLEMKKVNRNSQWNKGRRHCAEREAIGIRDSFRTTLGACDPE